MNQQEQQQEGIPLDQLPIQQLQMLRRQLEQEGQSLQMGLQQLMVALDKYQECEDCLRMTFDDCATKTKDQQVLMPLTNSVYVTGVVDSGDKRVLVDIGTGYVVEYGVKDAKEYYGRKMQFVKRQVGELEKRVQMKMQMRQMVEQVLQAKVQLAIQHQQQQQHQQQPQLV